MGETADTKSKDQDPESCSTVDTETAPLLPPESKDSKRDLTIEDGDMLFPPSDAGRHHPFLDITRICCVCCVAIDHGNPLFGKWNSLFTQDWVLQYLYLVCGVCFGMSRRSFWNYEVRLAAYVVLGISFNWTAWAIKGMDWQHNFFNVIFHLFFVIGLMAYAALLTPLKRYLDGLCYPRESPPEPTTTAAENPHTPGERSPQLEYRESMHIALLVIFGGLVAIWVTFTVVVEPASGVLAPLMWRISARMGTGSSFWGLPQDTAGARDFLNHICNYLMLSTSNIYLVIACPLIFRWTSLTTWAVFLNTYLHRLFYYRASAERPFHGLDLMVLATTCYYLGLRHRRVLGKYVCRYWFVVIFVIGLLWPPGTFGRLDEEPPTELLIRIRVNLMEAICILVWLCAGDLIIQPEIFTEDRLDFLNDAALVVFLVHKALHLILEPPLNWIALLAIVPLCKLWRSAQ